MRLFRACWGGPPPALVDEQLSTAAPHAAKQPCSASSLTCSEDASSSQQPQQTRAGTALPDVAAVTPRRIDHARDNECDSSTGDDFGSSLLQCSSQIQTAISLTDGRVFQTPRSVDFYGQRSDSQDPLAMLHALFALEGRHVYQEMMDTVLPNGLDNSAAVAGEKVAWRRVMRVPPSCQPSTRPLSVVDEVNGESSAAETLTGASNVQSCCHGPSTASGRHADAPLAATGCVTRAPEVMPSATERLPSSLAGARGSGSGLSTPHGDTWASAEQWQNRTATTHMSHTSGEPGTPVVAADMLQASVAMRHACPMMRSLLELSIATHAKDRPISAEFDRRTSRQSFQDNASSCCSAAMTRHMSYGDMGATVYQGLAAQGSCLALICEDGRCEDAADTSAEALRKACSFTFGARQPRDASDTCAWNTKADCTVPLGPTLPTCDQQLEASCSVSFACAAAASDAAADTMPTSAMEEHGMAPVADCAAAAAATSGTHDPSLLQQMQATQPIGLLGKLTSDVLHMHARQHQQHAPQHHRPHGVTDGPRVIAEEIEEEAAQETGSVSLQRSSSSHDSSTESQYGSEDQDDVYGADAAESCWHEVTITLSEDAKSKKPLLLVYQTDVTIRTQLEVMMASLTEAQLTTLTQIFPRHVVEFLSLAHGSAHPSDLGCLARTHSDVSIMFMDIVGFTTMSKQVPADAVMTFLNSLFSVFDELCTTHSVHKVETAGDCYIASSGLVSQDADGFFQVVQDHDPMQSAARLFAFAKDLLAASRKVLMPHNGLPVAIRIGLHTGPCVSGVVGSKLPKFGIFGDTMNTASRMESTCTPGRIQVSSATHALLLASKQSCASEWAATGGIEVKGKGVMETYLWDEPVDSTEGAPHNSGAVSSSVSTPHGVHPFGQPDSNSASNACASSQTHSDQHTSGSGAFKGLSWVAQRHAATHGSGASLSSAGRVARRATDAQQSVSSPQALEHFVETSAADSSRALNPLPPSQLYRSVGGGSSQPCLDISSRQDSNSSSAHRHRPPPRTASKGRSRECVRNGSFPRTRSSSKSLAGQQPSDPSSPYTAFKALGHVMDLVDSGKLAAPSVNRNPHAADAAAMPAFARSSVPVGWLDSSGERLPGSGVSPVSPAPHSLRPNLALLASKAAAPGDNLSSRILKVLWGCPDSLASLSPGAAAMAAPKGRKGQGRKAAAAAASWRRIASSSLLCDDASAPLDGVARPPQAPEA